MAAHKMKETKASKAKKPRLPPDELGVVGEAMFQSFATAARLVCNHSTRDKKGWDFMVQAREANSEDQIALDQRTEWSCHVQLKSTAQKKGTSVNVKLSTFEPFAKLPGPSLLVVFELRPGGDPKCGYVIPIIDDNLRRVLRRLRKAEAEGKLDLSKQVMSFDYRAKGEKFQLTPEGLKCALEDAVGDDQAAFIVEKQRQLSELGYEDGHLVGRMVFLAEQPDQLSRMWLGLDPVKVLDLAVFDARFGIPVPYKGDLFEKIDELQMTPPSLGRWNVAIKGPAFNDVSAVFETEAHLAPPQFGGPKALLKHRDFTITVEEDSLQFETKRIYGEGRRTLKEWKNFLRGLAHLASGKAKLTITMGQSGTMEFPVLTELRGPDVEDLPKLVDFFVGWEKLLEWAGVLAPDVFTIDEAESSFDAQMVVGLMLDPEPNCHFEFDAIDSIEDDVVTAVYFNTCAFGGAEITFSVQVTLERVKNSGTAYRSTKFAPLDVRAKVVDLKAYGREQGETLGAPVIIDPDFITFNQ